ncbi:MAG: porin family protein [Janthinobacterium lividum]
MRQHPTPLITGLCLLVTIAAQGQNVFSIGPLVGLTVAGANESTSPDITITYRTGLEAGVQSVLQLGHLAVQPSLRFTQKGLHYHYGSGLFNSDTDYRLNYLMLPLNLAYSLRSDGQGWQVFAGPHIGLLLGGNYQQHSLDRSGGGNYASAGDIKPGENYEVPPVGTTYYPLRCHRFDGGVQAGLGYRYGKLLGQAGFSFGLRDLGPQLPAFHNRTAHASLSYLLSSPGQ